MKISAIILSCGLWTTALLAQSTVSLDRAIELVGKDELRAATALLKSLTKDAEHRGAAHFWLGKIAMRQKHHAAAITSFEQAVAYSPEQDDYIMELFAAYAAAVKRAKPTQAKALFEKLTNTLQAAVIRMPDRPKPRLILATFYAQTPQELGGDFDAAVREARILIQLDAYRGRIFLGNMFTDHKRLSDAKIEYHEAILLRPDDVTARLRLGPILQDEKNYFEAHSLYNQVLQLEPGNLIALYQLGRLAALSGQFSDDGLASLERYLADASKEKPCPAAAAYWRMGNIAENKQDLRLASHFYDKALAADPKYSEAEISLRRLKEKSAKTP